MNIEKNINKFKKLLPLIQAYIDGKEVELLSGEKWVHTDLNNICIDADRFRIKPEPKFRPFKDAEECWQEMLKHQPFGWIYGGGYYSIVSISNETVNIVNDTRDIVDCLFSEMIEEGCTFVDGTPFGVKTKE